MANSTVRGNKMTKELKKGVSIMKKSLFKVLCMVLIIALLAPNALAATPTPEAPLADAATVERVKQEIAAGEITDMEDLFLVAYPHLGADLEEEGMPAYINEDGTLGLTQIVRSSRSEDGQLIKDEYVVTSVLLVDAAGNQLVNYHALYNSAATRAAGGLDSVMVHAVHSAHLNERLVSNGEDDDIDLDDHDQYELQVRLSYLSTTLSYGSNAFSASKLEQRFDCRQELFDVPHEGWKTTNSPSAGIDYNYFPSGTKWYTRGPDAIGGGIVTYATVYIANSDLNFTIQTIENLYYDPTLPNAFGGVIK